MCEKSIQLEPKLQNQSKISTKASEIENPQIKQIETLISKTQESKTRAFLLNSN